MNAEHPGNVTMVSSSNWSIFGKKEPVVYVFKLKIIYKGGDAKKEKCLFPQTPNYIKEGILNA
jgi:hypothetical protein